MKAGDDEGKRFKTRSVEETLALGERIAAMLHPPLLVILRGEVGAGKTSLVKGSPRPSARPARMR